MINYELPESINIDNAEYPINKRGDYRMVLDVITALNDERLDENEKFFVALNIFYNFNIPENIKEAAEQMLMFISCDEKEEQKSENIKPIMDWEQDFNVLVAPINKVLNAEIRSLPYLHWWTFISAYMEIGECQFATITSIRQKKQVGEKLEKWEQKFYDKNRKRVDLKIKYSEQEQEFMKEMFGE